MKKKFYRLENNYRVYKGDVDIECIFYSELNIHFLDYLNNGTKIYFLQFESKHNFSLNGNDLNYLYTLYLRRNESLNFVFSENIKKIKCSQRDDLFFLTSLKNIDFLILIPKLDINNCFYFNLIIGVNYFFDINQFYSLNLNSVNLKNINEITYFNLNECFLEKIFDLLDNKFKDNSINELESFLYENHVTLPRPDINSKLTKHGRRVYKKIIFKHICFHLYWFNNRIVKLGNNTFLMDWGYKDQILIKNENQELDFIKMYHYSSLIDMLVYSPEYLCFEVWELY